MINRAISGSPARRRRASSPAVTPCAEPAVSTWLRPGNVRTSRQARPGPHGEADVTGTAHPPNSSWYSVWVGGSANRSNRRGVASATSESDRSVTVRNWAWFNA